MADYKIVNFHGIQEASVSGELSDQFFLEATRYHITYDVDRTVLTGRFRSARQKQWRLVTLEDLNRLWLEYAGSTPTSPASVATIAGDLSSS